MTKLIGKSDFKVFLFNKSNISFIRIIENIQKALSSIGFGVFLISFMQQNFLGVIHIIELIGKFIFKFFGLQCIHFFSDALHGRTIEQLFFNPCPRCIFHLRYVSKPLLFILFCILSYSFSSCLLFDFQINARRTTQVV